MLNVTAAHAARRGQIDSVETKVARAVTRCRNGLHVGPHETAFAVLLDAAGIKYRQQAVCGFYNLDFALTEHPVAVEIMTGSGNRRMATRREERLKRILNEWHLFEVRLRTESGGRVVHPAVVDQLVAFCEGTRLHHPPPGKYRVVRADGQLVTLRGHKQDRGAMILSPDHFL